jgi:hypothetical protein
MAPTWEELATELKGRVNIAKVDCTIHKSVHTLSIESFQLFFSPLFLWMCFFLVRDLCSTQGARGFPTLKLYTAGSKQGVLFEGQRGATELKQFLVEKGVLDAAAAGAGAGGGKEDL